MRGAAPVASGARARQLMLWLKMSVGNPNMAAGWKDRGANKTQQSRCPRWGPPLVYVGRLDTFGGDEPNGAWLG